MKSHMIVALVCLFGCASNTQDKVSKEQPIEAPQGKPVMVPTAAPRLVQDLTPELVGPMPISRLMTAAGRAYYMAEGLRGYPCALHELNEAGEDVIVWRSATRACDVWWIEPTPQGLFMFLADGSLLQVKQGVLSQRGKIALPKDMAAPSWYMSWGLVLDSRDSCDEISCSQLGRDVTDEVVQDAAHLYWLMRDKQGVATLWALPMAGGEARLLEADMHRAQLAQRKLGSPMIWRCERDKCDLVQINSVDDFEYIYSSKDEGILRLIYSYMNEKIKSHCMTFLSEGVHDVMNISSHDIICVKDGAAKGQPFDESVYGLIFPRYIQVDHKMPDAPAGHGNFSSVALGARVWAIIGPMRFLVLDQTSGWHRQRAGEIRPRAAEPTVMVSERGGAWAPQGPALRSAHSGPIGLRAQRDGRTLFWARDQAHGFALRSLSQDGKRVEVLHALGAGEEVLQARALGALTCYSLSTGKRLCTYGAKNTTYLLESASILPAVTGLLQLREQDDHWMLVNAAGEVLIKDSIDPDLVIDPRPDVPRDEKFVAPEVIFIGDRIVVSRLINRDKNIYEIVSTDGTVKGTEVLGECEFCQKLPSMVPKRFKLNDVDAEDSLGGVGFAKWIDDGEMISLTRDMRYNTLEWCQSNDAGENTCWESDGTAKGTRMRATETQSRAVGEWALRKEEGEGEETGSYVSTLIASNAGGEVGRTRYTPRSEVFALGSRLVWMEPLVLDEEGERGKRLVSWTPGAGGISVLARWEDDSGEVMLGAQDGLLWFARYDFTGEGVSLWTRAQVRLGVTDGTEAGTRLLETEGPVPLEPRPVLTPAGLVFSMDHPQHGLELFVWPVEAR